MLITSRVSFEASLLSFTASSSLLVKSEGSNASLIGTSELSINNKSVSSGQASLPKLESLGGDYQLLGYGAGSSNLASLYSSGEGGMYIPETLQIGMSSLPPLHSTGLLLTSTPGVGASSLPALVSKGGEGNYGEGSSELAPLTSSGSEGLGNSKVAINAMVYAVSGTSGFFDLVVVIDSTGQIVDSIVGTRELIESMLGDIVATDSYSTLGEFIAFIDESLVGLSNMSYYPALNSSSRVWVVNLDSGTSGQYENYGYNSFFDRDGKFYGIADDGIDELVGDTDNSSIIEALVEVGRSNLGQTKVKTVPNVYLGASSSNKMILKVEADDKTYFYEARSNHEKLQNSRVDLGRGLKGNYYNFTLLNKDGGDFDIESISFNPIPLSRKINGN